MDADLALKTSDRMNTNRAAAYVRLSPRTLAIRRHYEQDPRYYRLENGRVEYAKEDLDAFLAKR
jgi:hypothetical protein